MVNVFDVNHNNPQQVKVNPPVRSCEDNSKVIKSRITVSPRSLCAGRGLRESMKLNEPETQKLKRNPSWRWVKHAELCYGLHLASKRRRLIALGSGFRATGTLCHRGARFLKCIYLLILLHFFYNCMTSVPMGFHPWKIRVAFPGESQWERSCATQPRGACCVF